MANASSRLRDGARDVAGDANEQLRQLRAQIDGLMRERVGPIVSDAANRAQDYGRQAGALARDYGQQAGDLAHDQSEALSGRVREMPLAAIAIAAVAGYLLGRLAR